MKTFLLLGLSLLSSVHAADYSKCGLYDVLGEVKLQKGSVFLDLKDGDAGQRSLKVLDAPYSLRLLESFPVKVKLNVKRISSGQMEARYVQTREDIQVLPGASGQGKVTLIKEEECSRSVTENVKDSTSDSI